MSSTTTSIAGITALMIALRSGQHLHVRYASTVIEENSIAGLSDTAAPHANDAAMSPRPVFGRLMIQIVAMSKHPARISVRSAGSNITIHIGFHPIATSEPMIATAALPVH